MKIAAILLAMTSLATAADYSAVIPRFEDAVREELREWQLGGIAVAWVDGNSTVFEAGFGEAKKDSVFRAGSVSKLFNAITVMQLVEAGKLDLDAAIAPSLLPENPFPGSPAVTLRQLLCHRSGLQRESTVGGYFDPNEPTLAATVASLRGGALATAPNAKMRYSNIGPSLAGLIAANAGGAPFERIVGEKIFTPLRMKNSAWLRRDTKCLASHMRIADGRGGFERRDTPLFDLGTIPAGNLYTTAGDLARFVAMLADDGKPILKPETLAEMRKPQLDEKGAFGLGFALGEWRGRKTVGHGGAVYGHSTAVTFLPTEKIGVIVLCNEDIANGRTQHLANLALSLMLEAKLGEKPPAASAETTDLATLAGAWESQSFWLEIAADGKSGNYATQPCKLSAAGAASFTLRSRIHDDAPVVIERDAAGKPTVLVQGVQRFTRVPAGRRIPDEWRAFLGSYGPEFIPLIVHEKHGGLYATTENMVDYRLTPLNRHTFTLPVGMYVDEQAVFLAGKDGKPWAVNFASMILPRR
jgi:CubicO group peptidase (beta-lactamase class C family)